MKNSLATIVIVLLLVIVGVAVFTTRPKPNGGLPPPEQTICTQDALHCPDGTYVGRTGPNCEFAACPGVPSNQDVATVAMRLGEKVTVSGIIITPTELVLDSRCPADVMCIQAGTVVVKLRLESGSAQISNLELGKSLSFAGKSVTFTSVMPVKNSKTTLLPSDYGFKFEVTKEVSEGTLSGQMSIGPVCPVERIDNPCTPTPEMYAARKVYIYALNSTTPLRTLTPDAQGKFSTSLPVGKYVVDMTHQAIGGISGVPQTITIEKGKNVVVNISVDTGIR